MKTLALAKHLSGYRRIWMFPRNIRSISPWKIAQMLSLFKRLTDYQEWSGNQNLQNNFCKALEAAGLKEVGTQYDPRSGGPRTYLAQFKCLGLVFERDDGRIFLTKAGEDIATGESPAPHNAEPLVATSVSQCIFKSSEPEDQPNPPGEAISVRP